MIMACSWHDYGMQTWTRVSVRGMFKPDTTLTHNILPDTALTQSICWHKGANKFWKLVYCDDAVLNMLTSNWAIKNVIWHLYIGMYTNQ